MKKWCFIGIGLLIFGLVAQEIRLNAEKFTLSEHWKCVTFLGESALEAVSKGGGATAAIELTAPGQYHLWARVATHGENYRRTSILVNRMKYLTAGDEKISGEFPRWHWVKAAAELQLRAGKNQVELRAGSPCARLAEIVLTDQADFSPAAAEKKAAASEVYSREKEGIFPRPLPSGNGPDMLLLSGGRPWVGNAVANTFAAGGYRVKLLNSVYLAGLGGASIKITPTDPVEPEPLDGITPEFNRTNRYKIIVINDIPQELQARLLTPERVEKLRKFIADGGALLLTINAPLRVLSDLAPVEPTPGTEGELCELEDFYVRRPDRPEFKSLPESWKLWRSFRLYKTAAGAETLAEILTPDGTPSGVPYLAQKHYGKGKVLFWNSQIGRQQSAQQLFSWAYRSALATAVAAVISPGKGVDPDKLTIPPARELDSQVLPAATAKITDPVMKLVPLADPASIQGRTITFASGIKMVVKDSGIDVYYPGLARPVISDLNFPAVFLPKGADKVDDHASAEAVGTKSQTARSQIRWQVGAITGGESAKIELSDGENRCEWIFTTAKLQLDGREFFGIGQQIKLTSFPGQLIADLVLNYHVDVENRNFRRFACYQAPRGYKNFDFSGKVDSDTRRWGFFGDGQPFTYLEGAAAVFTEFVDAPAAVSTQYQVKKGDRFATAQTQFRFGRVKAPQTTPVLYQLIGAASYHTSNDWIAMYQFVRHYLRQKTGFPEIPAHPIADSMNTCTDAERRQITQAAADFGFKVKKIGICPFPMESFETPEVLAYFDECKKVGIAARPWFPCCHSPDKTRTVVEHPDWYNQDETGKPAKYFGHFYTADMNNPEFRKWHFGVIDQMFDHGVNSVWYDMAGAAAGTVNFGTPESPIGLGAQLEIFRHYADKGGFVVSEGMNPLVLDGYIFRENVYNEPVGNEFAMIGAQIELAGWRCDFFRLAMYDIFFPIPLDPLVLDFEYTLGGIDQIKRAISFIPTLNKLLAQGMPFIRETPFGTSWVSANGGAFFFWDGVEDFRAEVPADFVPESLVTRDGITPLAGKLPRTLPRESIVTFTRRK